MALLPAPSHPHRLRLLVPAFAGMTVRAGMTVKTQGSECTSAGGATGWRSVSLLPWQCGNEKLQRTFECSPAFIASSDVIAWLI